jgi:hypothetical protein
MTNKEAKKALQSSIVSEERGKDGKPNGNITCDLTREVLEKAMRALDLEECDDCVRKDSVLEILADSDLCGDLYDEIFNKIDSLPNVKPSKFYGWKADTLVFDEDVFMGLMPKENKQNDE